ncbi:MAG TPA: hypothetical protein ENM98_00235 [Halothiobacillaceae bacterium]|nr:hypothetical protein [Halothiobacillaceae bacterium]
MPDYQHIQQQFHTINAQPTPAEAQGVLIGMWLGQGPCSLHDWVRELTDVPLTDEEIPRDVHDIFEDFVSCTTTADNLGLNLLLPDESFPLNERVRTLTEFAQAVLYGYAISGGKPPHALDEQSKEVFDDLEQIANLDTENLDDSEDEFNLHEIEQYLSSALLVMYLQLHPPVPETNGATRLQ